MSSTERVVMWLRSPEERFMCDRKVIVHSRNADQTFEGFLVRETKNNYWLSRAKLVAEKTDFDLEGTVMVRKSDAWLQVLGPEQAA
jgi:hypothetical protein